MHYKPKKGEMFAAFPPDKRPINYYTGVYERFYQPIYLVKI
jgi:hypothetical protein